MLGFDALAKIPLAASAESSVYGALNVAQDGNTLTATGALSTGIVGNLSITQDSNAVSAAGAVTVKGSLSRTQAGNTVSAAGAVPVKGDLSVTQGNQTLSAVGFGRLNGAFSVTQDSNTVVSAAKAIVSASLPLQTTWTFDTDVSGWSAVGTGAILTWDAANQQAQVETTEQQQGMSTTVPLPTGGDYRVDVTITNGASVSRSYRATMGAGVSGFVTVPAGATQTSSFFVVGADSSTLVIRTAGIFTPTAGEKHYFDSVSVFFSQRGNTVSSSGTAQIKGLLSRTQASDTVSAAGTVQVKGDLSVTQGDQVLTGLIATKPIEGFLDKTQDNQTLSATATTLGLSETQDDNTLSATGTVTLSEAPCVIRATVTSHYIVATVELSQVPVTLRASASYVSLATSVSYPAIKYRTCWNVVADREAA